MDPLTHHLLRIAGEGLALNYRGAVAYEARLRPDGWMVLGGEPVTDLNYVFVDDGPHAEALLTEYVEVLMKRTVPAIVLSVPSAFERLSDIARQLGLRHAGSAPFMIYEPNSMRALVGDFHIEHVDDDAQLAESNDLLSRAFLLPLPLVNRTFGTGVLGGPGVDMFVARRDGEPFSTVTTTRADRTVGIWAMATPPERQRRGAGRAAIEAAMAYHAERGAQRFYLFASAAGKPLYDNVGFQTLVEVPVWLSGESTQVSGH